VPLEGVPKVGAQVPGASALLLCQKRWVLEHSGNPRSSQMRLLQSANFACEVFSEVRLLPSLRVIQSEFPLYVKSNGC
jgi:hypothetical protein